MKFSEFANLPVVDGHIHFGEFGPGKVQLTAERIKKMGDFIIEVMKKGNLSQAYIIGRNAGLYLKARYPGMFYAGGYAPWSGETESLKVSDWHEYIDSLIEMGFDGIGEMGNKPAPRRVHRPIDGDYYKGF